MGARRGSVAFMGISQLYCTPESPPDTYTRLAVVDIERFVCDEHYRDIGIRRSSVFHVHPLGEPDEAARSIGSRVCDQCPFEHIHTVRTMMRMKRVDHACGVSNEPDFHARVGIF